MSASPNFFVLSCVLTSIAVSSATYFLTPVWDFLTSKQVGYLGPRIEQLGGGGLWVGLGLRIWTVISVATSGLLLVVAMPIGIVVAVFSYMAPRHVLDFLIQRRSMKLEDQLVPLSRSLVSSVRSGVSIEQALENSRKEIAEPLRGEVEKLVLEYQNGISLTSALYSRRQALKFEPFSLFAISLETTLERDIEITKCLEKLSFCMEENQRLQRRIASTTSAGRYAILLMSFFPLLFLFMAWMIMPNEVTVLVETFWGHVTIAAAMMCVYLGRTWAASVLKLEV